MAVDTSTSISYSTFAATDPSKKRRKGPVRGREHNEIRTLVLNYFVNGGACFSQFREGPHAGPGMFPGRTGVGIVLRGLAHELPGNFL